MGYPILREAGVALRREGVYFHDITQVFLHHPEPLYIDQCCHVSSLGSRIMATEVIRWMLHDMLR